MKVSAFSLFIILTMLGIFTYTVSSAGRFREKKLDNKVATPEQAQEPTQTKVLGENDVAPEVPKEKTPFPRISATAYLVFDLNQDITITEKNAQTPLPPASTTKIMTALVALEEYDLTDKIMIPANCLNLQGTASAYLQFNDSLSVESLLYALLLPSASDAACTLAHGNNNPTEFLAKMNYKAEELGLKNTNFNNVIGLDENNHLSSAQDLLLLAKEAMKNKEFMKIVGTKSYTIPSYSSEQTYEVRNTNELLFNLPGTVGIKTGETDRAKGCLVYAYENKGKSVIIVVLGSNERFIDTSKLLGWYLENF